MKSSVLLPAARRVFLGSAALVAALAAAPVGAQPASPTSAAIVAEICDDEHQAVRNYRAYARKALEEGNPAVAHFFEALATSESVHARNFMEQLRRLDPAAGPKAVDPAVQSSRKNLRHALEVELSEIDVKYPEHIDHLRRDGQQDAVRVAIWAWESEKQHRELITQLEQGTGLLFGVLESKLRKWHFTYVICDVCGSTYVERPAGDCPICRSDAGNYREVQPPTAAKEPRPPFRPQGH